MDREYLRSKLQAFHRVHQTPVQQTVRDLNEAFLWLPESSYAEEGKSLAELARKRRRGTQPIGDLLLPLLVRLGMQNAEEVELKTSEARSSH